MAAHLQRRYSRALFRNAPSGETYTVAAALISLWLVSGLNMQFAYVGFKMIVSAQRFFCAISACVDRLSMHTCIRTNTNILPLISALEGVPLQSVGAQCATARKAVHPWCLLVEH